MAQIVGSWDPCAEEVNVLREEMGGEGGILPTRANNGVFVLHEVKKGPNKA